MLLKAQISSDEKVLCSYIFVTLEEILPQLNISFSYDISGTCKVVALRNFISNIMLSLYLNLSPCTTSIIHEHAMFYSEVDPLDKVFYSLKVKIQNDFDDYKYQKDENLTKFDIARYFKHKKIHLSGFNREFQTVVADIPLVEGEIGNDICRFIYKLSMGSIIGALGVGIDNLSNNIVSASGFLFESYDSNVSNFLRSISDSIVPSRQLLCLDDFYSIFTVTSRESDNIIYKNSSFICKTLDISKS